MEYTVEYFPDKEIVGVKMKGRLNFRTAEQFSTEAIKLARQNDCTKFLIDHTETSMPKQAGNIHADGEEMQQFGFKNTDHIAVVISNSGNGSKVDEPAIQNIRWSDLRYFYSGNIQEAYNWLAGIE